MSDDVYNRVNNGVYNKASVEELAGKIKFFVGKEWGHEFHEPNQKWLQGWRDACMTIYNFISSCQTSTKALTLTPSAESWGNDER